MKRIFNDQLIESLQWRYAVKKFDPSKKISDDDWQTLQESLVLTPSSYGLQPLRYLVINNSSLRKQLRIAAWGQSQVEDCSHFVVFVAKNDISQDDVDSYLDRIVKVREVPMEKLTVFRQFMEEDLFRGQRSKMIREWTARQTYIALGNLMTSAAVLGIDTCPMEGLVPEDFDKILGLEESGYRTVVACALGYRSSDDPHQSARKVRSERNNLVHVF